MTLDLEPAWGWLGMADKPHLPSTFSSSLVCRTDRSPCQAPPSFLPFSFWVRFLFKTSRDGGRLTGRWDAACPAVMDARLESHGSKSLSLSSYPASASDHCYRSFFFSGSGVVVSVLWTVGGGQWVVSVSVSCVGGVGVLMFVFCVFCVCSHVCALVFAFWCLSSGVRVSVSMFSCLRSRFVFSCLCSHFSWLGIFFTSLHLTADL